MFVQGLSSAEKRDAVIAVVLLVPALWIIVRMNIWYYKRRRLMISEERKEEDRIAQIENQIW